MPYPKLAEGNRVITAVAGNTIVDADINEIQDQLKTILGPNDRVVPTLSGYDPSAKWSQFTLYDPKDPPYWSISTTSIYYLYFPVPFLKEGMKITRFYAVTYGNAAGGDDGLGKIDLHKKVVAAAAAAVTTTNLIASAFSTGGVLTWALKDSGALAITVTANSEYFLCCHSAWDAGGAKGSGLLGAYFKVQEGN